MQDQIDASVEDAVIRARRAMGQGQGLSHCEECGEPIPEPRRLAVPGVRRCVRCQGQAESRDVDSGPVNRRGSKDSQLR